MVFQTYNQSFKYSNAHYKYSTENNDKKHSNFNLELSWDERVLLAVNIEYIWHSMIMTQETILSKFNKHLEKKLKQQEGK